MKWRYALIPIILTLTLSTSFRALSQEYQGAPGVCPVLDRNATDSSIAAFKYGADVTLPMMSAHVSLTPRQAAQKGLDFLIPAGQTWQNTNNCYGCHVQTFAIVGGSVGVQNAFGVNTSTLTNLTTGMISLVRGQKPDGCFAKQSSEINTTTQFAIWALAYYDRLLGSAYFSNLQRAVDCLSGRRSGGCLNLDHYEAPVDQSTAMATANFMAGAKRCYEVTGDTKYQTWVQDGVNCLRNTTPSTTQDIVFIILGLKLAGAPDSDSKIQAMVALLRGRQNADGGWGYSSTWGSYPYGTGEALYGLKSAGISTTDPAIQNGITFLLNTQSVDGSWPELNWPGGRPSKFASTMWAVLGLVDLTPPMTVEIISPLDGERVPLGDTVSISVSATTNNGVAVDHIDLYIDGQKVVTQNDSILSYSWSTAGLTEERYYPIKAVAFNTDGQSSSDENRIILGNLVVVSFTANPNPFDPHPPANQVTTLQYELLFSGNQPGLVDVKILDQQNSVVKTLLNQASQQSGLNSVGWNGSQDAGGIAPYGHYLARIDALDVNSNTQGSLTEQVIAAMNPAQAATIAGKITELDGVTPIKDALVKVLTETGDLHGSQMSTATGSYRISTLLGGISYKVVVSKQGYAPSYLNDMSLVAGETRENVNFALESYVTLLQAKQDIIDYFNTEVFYSVPEAGAQTFLNAVDQNIQTGTATPMDVEALQRLTLVESAAKAAYCTPQGKDIRAIALETGEATESFIYGSIIAALFGSFKTVLEPFTKIPWIGGLFKPLYQAATAINLKFTGYVLNTFASAIANKVEVELALRAYNSGLTQSTAGLVGQSAGNEMYQVLVKVFGIIGGKGAAWALDRQNMTSLKQLINGGLMYVYEKGFVNTNIGGVNIRILQGTGSSIQASTEDAINENFTAGLIDAVAPQVHAAEQDITRVNEQKYNLVKGGNDLANFIQLAGLVAILVAALYLIIAGLVAAGPSAGWSTLVSIIGAIAFWGTLSSISAWFSVAKIADNLVTSFVGIEHVINGMPNRIELVHQLAFDQHARKADFNVDNDGVGSINAISQWSDSLRVSADLVAQQLEETRSLVAEGNWNGADSALSALWPMADVLDIRENIANSILVSSFKSGYLAGLADSIPLDSIYIQASSSAASSDISIGLAQFGVSLGVLLQPDGAARDSLLQSLDMSVTRVQDLGATYQNTLDQITSWNLQIPPILSIVDYAIDSTTRHDKSVFVHFSAMNISSVSVDSVVASLSELDCPSASILALSDTFATSLAPSEVRRFEWQIDLAGNCDDVLMILSVHPNRSPGNFVGDRKSLMQALTGPHVGYTCGDADGTGQVDLSDVIFLVNYIFGGGLAPEPIKTGDVDCNGRINLTDAVYLVNYIFGGGPVPCAACK